jgi:hypothetical protein
MQIRSWSSRLLTIFALAALPELAAAQATRTWVSGVGDDVNPCSRTAPCKTLAGAISKTAAKGEINILDSAGIGAVTITKAITIRGEGVTAGVLSSGTNGIVINAAAADVVILQGLDIQGAGTGLNGIRFLAGGSLHVDNCYIGGFTQKGIDFEPTTAAQLFVTNTLISNNAAAAGGAIFVRPGVGGSAIGSIDNVNMERNHFGVHIEGAVTMAVRDSVATANTTHGFNALNTSAARGLMLERVSSFSNGLAGVRSDGAGTVVRITDATIFGNANGMQVNAGGTIVSIGNNRNAGNTVDGAPTSSVAQQ